MSDVWIYVIDWVHVLSGALWIGGAFFAALVAGPALGKVPSEAGAEMSVAFAKAAAWYFRITATVAIVFGVIISLGKGGGSWPVGAALVLALALMGYGEAVMAKLGRAVMTSTLADRPAAIAKVVRASIVEQVGFLFLLALMVVLRYQ